MKPKTLNKLLIKWQKRLRIQDWDITVKIVSKKGMLSETGADVLGSCYCCTFKKVATVLILDPTEVDSNEDDLETVLIHELLHVVMNPNDLNIDVGDSNPIHIAYERIIDQMARTLRGAFDGKD